MRTLDNAGRRRFVVVECDCIKWEKLPESDRAKHGTEALYLAAQKDQQAAVLWHLARFGPLTMVVDSGGKSLHAWYFCDGQPEPLLRDFMRLAVSLGADPATWSRCHLVRMPDGTRDSGARQAIKFFNPETVRYK